MEVCFPVYDPKLKKRVIAEGLMAYLEDDTLAWAMSSDGSYAPPQKPDDDGVNAQERLLQLLSTPAPA